MTKRMLIDASHAEEARVVVLDGNRLEDFDVETSAKRQLKGNIYLAKVVRVEPSLQAAFVEYGGNRHGFLAFSEIHPDYYQIPVADRQRLLDMEAEEARREEEEADLEIALDQAHTDAPVHDAQADEAPGSSGGRGATSWAQPETDLPASPAGDPSTANRDWPAPQPLVIEPELLSGPVESASPTPAEAVGGEAVGAEATGSGTEADQQAAPSAGTGTAGEETTTNNPPNEKRPTQFAQSPEAAELYGAANEGDAEPEDLAGYESDEDDDNGGELIERVRPETVGGENDTGEERTERRMPPRFLRNYKIQEVVRRRQILLVQVVKEERGTKGAALTTYISLAGRFSVLMPNSPRGGGISRKITSAADRRRLKEVMTELELPRGMGLIVRTAGANRPKPEIKRDCEYLLRLWDDIRDHTMNSVAPALIYEEASLIKRAIRDVYSRDVDDILVDGEEGWRAAHDFMRMLMPTHAKKVQLWRDPMPLFARYQVEAQLDAMLLPNVQLRSGGYLVINQAEALVAIDVNSGRSTRERGIEETALRTNLEAADEVARQLRLRDLAGLIVIDFIDMEHRKNNAMVERRLKEALKNDRARIQVGQISHFGLMEMSRQRLRPSLAETSFVGCPHCAGTGHVRSTESAAIHVLRGIEDEGGKRRAAEIVVHVSTPIALYLLNHKRERLQEIEQRYVMRVIIAADDAQFASQYRIERVRPQIVAEALAVVTPDVPQIASSPAVAATEYEPDQDEESEEEDEAVDARADEGAPAEAREETAEEAEHRRKRRRRRRRGRRDDVSSDADAADAPQGAAGEPVQDAAFAAAPTDAIAAAAAAADPTAAYAGQADARQAGAGEAGAGGADAGGADAGGADAGGMDRPAMSAAATDEMAAADPAEASPDQAQAGASADEEARNRRRGRRGGRRRRREPGDAELAPVAEPGAEQPELPPLYTGPTPANPFGGQAFDIFDVLDQAEQTVTARSRFEQRPVNPASTGGMEITNTASPDPAMEALEPFLPPAAREATIATEPASPVAAIAAAPEVPPPGDAQGGASDVGPVSDPENTGLGNVTVSVETGDRAESDDGVGQGEAIANSTAPDPALTEPLEAPVPAEESVASVTVTPVAEPDGALAHAAETSLSVVPAMSAPDQPLVPANDESEPAIKPIVIGSADAPPAEKKRGWWRR